MKLCSFDYNQKFTFQYNFWDRFRRIHEEELPLVLHLARLLAHLVGQQALSLTIFKAVDFFQLKAMDVLFYRLVFTRLFADNPLQTVCQLFERLSSDVKQIPVRESLQNFFKSAFRKSSLQQRELYTEEEAAKIRQCLKEIATIFRQAPTNLV